MTNEKKVKKIADKIFESCTNVSFYDMAIEIGTNVAEWKDEQFNEERKDLLCLVKMIPINGTNQTIIEDLIGLLQ